ncbi:MAG: PDZ domain-containing protein [Planctomycetota bacterium]
MRTQVFAALLAIALGSVGAPAQDDPVEDLADALAERADRRAEAARLGSEAAAALEARELVRAEALLREQIELDPGNFVPYYNLACVHSVEFRVDDAAKFLGRAVELGFISREQLARDPWLENLRHTDFYLRLLSNWDRVIEARRQAQMAAVRTWLDGRVEHIAVDDLRIDVLSHHDPRSTEMAVEDLRQVARWAASVSPELFAVEDSDPWTVVVLPERTDFVKWAVATFGPSARRPNACIGGAYEHDRRRLVAQDLGPTLRHEFLHVLHWRGMDRLGQRHPIWIQEGLASLVEDLDPVRMGSDTLRPAPSRRTNVVKRLAKVNRLPKLDELAGLSHQRFSTRRPLAQYAQARTLFFYLDDRGLLGPWLNAYVGDPVFGYDDDPTGTRAFDRVTEKPRDEAWRDYRVWASRSLAEAPESFTDIDASLGIGIEPGDGDGPRVNQLPPGARGRTGLRLGDIVTSIDGRTTRTTDETVRILASYRPGDSVTLTYRRGRLHGETEFALVATR